MRARVLMSSGLAAALLIGVPGVARAGTVTTTVRFTSTDNGNLRTQTLSFEGRASERNRVDVWTEGTTVVFRDTAAETVVGSGCVRQTPNEARCEVLPPRPDDLRHGDRFEATRVVVRGGEGHDWLRGRSVDVGLELQGGAGDDRLESDAGGVLDGGPGRDRLLGSPADDVLRGGTGNDVISAAAGDDVLYASGGGLDHVDGGTGKDLLSYAGESRSVTVDLARPERGRRLGSFDRLQRVENVVGGEGPDVLLGDGRDNWLAGGDGGGGDRINGRGGNDILSGGGVRDVLRGGPGDDLITQLRGDIACGTGADAVAAPDLDELRQVRALDPSCEWFDGSDHRLWISRSVRRGTRVLIVDVYSRAMAPLDVTAWITAESGSLEDTVGTHTTRVAPGARRRIRVPLTSVGRRYLANGATSVGLLVRVDNADVFHGPLPIERIGA